MNDERYVIATTRRLKAEWFRHGLHGANVRGEQAIPAAELRQLIADYQQILLPTLDALASVAGKDT